MLLPLQRILITTRTKRQLSDAQKAALAKALEKAKVAEAKKAAATKQEQQAKNSKPKTAPSLQRTLRTLSSRMI